MRESLAVDRCTQVGAEASRITTASRHVNIEERFATPSNLDRSFERSHVSKSASAPQSVAHLFIPFPLS